MARTNANAAAAATNAAKTAFVFDKFEGAVAPQTSEIRAIAAAQVEAGNSKIYDGISVLQAWATPSAKNTLVASVTMRLGVMLPTNTPLLGLDGKVQKSIDGHNLYEIASGNRISTSSYTIAAACREGNAAVHAMACSLDPCRFVPDLLEGAKIDLLATYVPKGTLYVNPFAKSDKGFTSPSDRMVFNVLAVHLSNEVIAADNAAKLAAIAASRNMAFKPVTPATATATTAAPATAITSGDPFQ